MCRNYTWPYEQVARRWSIVRSQEMFKGLSYWCLVPKNDPETLDMRCTMTLLPLPALLVRAGSKQVEQTTTLLVDHAIVPPHYKRNGCASSIFSVCLLWIDPHAVATLMASKLADAAINGAFDDLKAFAFYGFSDCGENIWRRAADSNLYKPSQLIYDAQDHQYDPMPANVEYLTAEQVVDMAEIDARYMSEELLKRDPTKSRFAIRPTRDLYATTIMRNRIGLAFDRGEDRVPTRFGARIGDRAWMFFTYSERDRCL
jgi:hypothetical protein